MEKIYLVIGHAGEYSDYRTAVVEAWTDQQAAEDRARQLDVRTNELKGQTEKVWSLRRDEKMRRMGTDYLQQAYLFNKNRPTYMQIQREIYKKFPLPEYEGELWEDYTVCEVAVNKATS